MHVICFYAEILQHIVWREYLVCSSMYIRMVRHRHTESYFKVNLFAGTNFSAFSELEKKNCISKNYKNLWL